ncbi:SUA5 domain protein [compost metagenome]
MHLDHREALAAGPENAGYLLFSKYIEGIDKTYQRILSRSGDLKEAAHNLFAHLRELDSMPVAEIRAELVPMHGLGLAINDRLQRASVTT